MTERPKIKVTFEIDADVKNGLLDVLTAIASIASMIGENLKAPASSKSDEVTLSDKVRVVTESSPEAAPEAPKPSNKVFVPNGKPGRGPKSKLPFSRKDPSFDSAAVVSDEQILTEIAKLTEAEKRAIKAYYASGKTAISIGRNYLVNYRTVLRVIYGAREA